MNGWLRWHIGTCEDGKFRMISRNAKVTVGNAIALWSLLLEDASHPDHRGICTRGEDFYGAILDLEFQQIADILGAMERLDMISVGHGNITISNWNKRQFETDAKDPTNAERQRRYKDKKKQNAEQTNGNGSVTVEKHQIQITESDTDKKEKINKKENLEFDYIWELYDFKDVKKKSLESFEKCQKHYSAICQAIPDYKNYLKATGYPPCSLAVWLNQERWTTDYKQLTEKFNASTSQGKVNGGYHQGNGGQAYPRGKPSTSEQLARGLERIGEKYAVND